MSLVPTTEAVPITTDANGTLCIGGTRVTLDTVINAFNAGATPEEIVHQFSSLTLADVYLVVGHYLRNTADVDEYLSQRELVRQSVKQENDIRFDPKGIRDRLLARKQVV